MPQLDANQRLIRTLERQLRASLAREKRLIELLAAKEEQIRTVIDEKYFRPVVAAGKTAPQLLKPPVDFRELTDQPQFSPEADKEVIAENEEAFQQAEEAFNAALSELEQEQEESHAPEAAEEVPAEAIAP